VSDELLKGRYRRVAPLGYGAMGEVWLADDLVLGRRVAIKRLRPDPRVGIDQGAIDRMVREARTAARLHHRNIVTVFDLLTENEQPYVVMEYVEGETLADHIGRSGRLRVDRVRTIGEQVASALAAAHQTGIVHRDVKPANIMVERLGEAKLADFGIARAGGDPALTDTGQMLGTIAYMAPEIARSGAASPASDMWSFGATLYAALEGRPPHDDGSQPNSTEMLIRLVSNPVPRPEHAGSLEPLIMSMLAFEPAQRPTADAVRRQLAAPPASTSIPESTAPAAPAATGPTTHPETEDGSAAGSGAGSAAGSGAGFASGYLVEPTRRRESRPPAPEKADLDPTRREVRPSGPAQDLDATRREVRPGTEETARVGALPGTSSTAGSPDDLATARLAAGAGSSRHRPRPPRRRRRTLVLVSVIGLLAVAGGIGVTLALRRPDRPDRPDRPAGRFVGAAHVDRNRAADRYSPDGDTRYTFVDGKVAAVDVAQTRVARTGATLGASLHAYYLAASRDGRTVVVLATHLGENGAVLNSTAFALDAKTLSERARRSFPADLGEVPGVLVDQGLLVADGGLSLLDLDDLAAVRRLTNSSDVRQLTISPDGDTVYAVTRRSGIQAIAAGALGITRFAAETGATPICVTVGDRGLYLVSTPPGRAEPVLTVVDRGTGTAGPPIALGSNSRCGGVTPDERYVVTSGYTRSSATKSGSGAYVIALDRTTGHATRIRITSAPFQFGAAGVIGDHTAVWVQYELDGTKTDALVDLTSGAVTPITAVGDVLTLASAGGGPAYLGDGARLTRIDPGTGRTLKQTG
jgi:serine/threonine protein kinase